jgi:hypothetical protein
MRRDGDDDARNHSIDRDGTQERLADSSRQPLTQETEGRPSAHSQGSDERTPNEESRTSNAHRSNGDDSFDASETSNRFSPFDLRRKKNRSRQLIGGIVVLIIVASAFIGFYYAVSPSRSVKVNISTKQPGRITDSTDATATRDKTPDDLTTEAIAELRSAVSKSPTATTSSVPNAPGSGTSLNPGDNQKLASSDAPTSDIGSPEKPIDTMHQETAPASRRNREQSIRFPADGEQMGKGKVNPASPRPNAAAVQRDVAESRPPRTTDNSRDNSAARVASNSRVAPSKPTTARVVLPTFGSVLPVRTLGKIYTLRSGSSIRLELTRYISGEGWSLPKGTVLIGQVRGSEQDRAFIGITGFIEPSRGRFVRLAGETLGDDGGSGIRGKFHKLSSGWSRAFARVGSAAVNVAGAIAGSRISGQPVIVTDIGSRTISPFSNEVDSSLLQQARGFVEVPAGTAAFVMVTTLPADVEGVDAEPDHLASDTAKSVNGIAGQQAPLTQEELALLLTSGDPERIREALPRMSPQMRPIAEVVLAESSHQQPGKQ